MMEYMRICLGHRKHEKDNSKHVHTPREAHLVKHVDGPHVRDDHAVKKDTFEYYRTRAFRYLLRHCLLNILICAKRSHICISF